MQRERATPVFRNNARPSRGRQPMWFKTLRIYRLTAPLTCEADALAERLEAYPFKPCGGLDLSRTGWVPALDAATGGYVHSHADQHLLCARTQTRLLPAAAVREAVDDRIAEQEAREGRKLGRRERSELKDDTVANLLPRALTRSQLTRAVLIESKGLLLIDARAAARAEDLLSLLRETLGTLAVKPLVPARNPVEIMTAWLAGTRLPNSLSLGQQCDLRDPLHQANMVRCRAQELATREVRNHLEAGKTVASLGLEWSGRLQFALAEDLSLSAIKYLDVRERDAGYEGEGDAEQLARLDADFVLMSMELDKLVTDLLEVFGSAE